MLVKPQQKVLITEQNIISKGANITNWNGKFNNAGYKSEIVRIPIPNTFNDSIPHPYNQFAYEITDNANGNPVNLNQNFISSSIIQAEDQNGDWLELIVKPNGESFFTGDLKIKVWGVV